MCSQETTQGLQFHILGRKPNDVVNNDGLHTIIETKQFLTEALRPYMMEGEEDLASPAAHECAI